MRHPSLVKNMAYHIYNRAVAKRLLFKDNEDFTFFMLRLHQYKKRFDVELKSFCIMPNHFHVILRSKRSAEDISKFMKSLQQSYARRFNKKYESYGHVFQGTFKHRVIRTSLDLKRVIKYIKQNPVKKGLVKFSQNWRYLFTTN